jgi:hypothetical protein
MGSKIASIVSPALAIQMNSFLMASIMARFHSPCEPGWRLCFMSAPLFRYTSIRLVSESTASTAWASRTSAVVRSQLFPMLGILLKRMPRTLPLHQGSRQLPSGTRPQCRLCRRDNVDVWVEYVGKDSSDTVSLVMCTVLRLAGRTTSSCRRIPWGGLLSLNPDV